MYQCSVKYRKAEVFTFHFLKGSYGSGKPGTAYGSMNHQPLEFCRWLVQQQADMSKKRFLDMTTQISRNFNIFLSFLYHLGHRSRSYAIYVILSENVDDDKSVVGRFSPISNSNVFISKLSSCISI